MNAVRERILLDAHESLSNYPFSEHRDLIAFCVCSGFMLDYEEDDSDADFEEVIAVVDKDWLFDFMEVDDPRDYLVNEYTSDDSIVWYDEANRTGHLAMAAFN